MEDEVPLATFGRFLRERRKELGLTQTELGNRLGWAQERVSVLEHGKYGTPSLPQLCRLADALEVSLQHLLMHLGVQRVPTSLSNNTGSSGEARLRLKDWLDTMATQMRVVEECLHAAEHQMEKVETLRGSIQEQSELMAALLSSYRAPESGEPQEAGLAPTA